MSSPQTVFKAEQTDWTEIINGEEVSLMPTGFLHGRVEAMIIALLTFFVRQNKLGVVFGGETGIYTKRNPDTVRGVDAAFISHERLVGATSTSYLDVAPELVVEVMSPWDSWTDINDKLNEYFTLGVMQVWIINPKREEVQVYLTRTHFNLLKSGDKLTGGAILPGFEIEVAEIFEVL